MCNLKYAILNYCYVLTLLAPGEDRCATTLHEINAWWTLDLQKMYKVKTIEFTNCMIWRKNTYINIYMIDIISSHIKNKNFVDVKYYSFHMLTICR